MDKSLVWQAAYGAAFVYFSIHEPVRHSGPGSEGLNKMTRNERIVMFARRIADDAERSLKRPQE